MQTTLTAGFAAFFVQLRPPARLSSPEIVPKRVTYARLRAMETDDPDCLGSPFSSALLSFPSAVSVTEHLSAFFARQCVQKEDAGTTGIPQRKQALEKCGRLSGL